MTTTHKALLYVGPTDTDSYKHNLFSTIGAIMLPDLVYLPNPGANHTLEDVKEATEKLVAVRTDGDGTVDWIEVTSFEAFKREWLNIVGRPFK